MALPSASTWGTPANQASKSPVSVPGVTTAVAVPFVASPPRARGAIFVIV